jgi:hypothetical protein
MTVIQIVLILFAVFGFAAAVSRYRRGGLSFRQLALWSLLWLGVAAVASRPDAATIVARRLGVGRGADVVVYLALAAAFYLLFRLLARLEDHERQITRLTRELALKGLETHERR